MLSTVLTAAAIVILACIGFVIVGTVYKWDLTAPGYNRWTIVVGVLAVLALSGVTAWDRIDEPMTAATVMVLGVALSVGYVLLHRRLAARIREMLGSRDTER